MSKLLPNMTMVNSMGYYRYMGSLTTPPCTEGVIWNVFRQPIKLSAQQVIIRLFLSFIKQRNILKLWFKFFKMQAFYTSSIKFNARPVQPLNGRTVYFSANQ